uniref:Reverse transcriptase domain-containing protein n=1 Tax=Haemonchus contortus TaxID=6289 RepID=A0A7I4Z4E1_HAECO
MEKVLVNKACRMAVKQSLREYRRTNLLEAVEARSSIRRCERDLNDQKAVMSALLDKDGRETSRAWITSKQSVSLSREAENTAFLWPFSSWTTRRRSTVEINAVLNALVQAGVDPAYVHLLEQRLSNTSTFIQLFDRKLKIPVGKGVRQGDTISPKLFTAALQHAMVNLDWEERGYPFNGKKINNLRFADDIVLISSSAAEMEKMLNELNAVSRRMGLEINVQNAIDG